MKSIYSIFFLCPLSLIAMNNDMTVLETPKNGDRYTHSYIYYSCGNRNAISNSYQEIEKYRNSHRYAQLLEIQKYAAEVLAQKNKGSGISATQDTDQH